MIRNLHPKCFNPACATPFDWMAGGRFFRFRNTEKYSGDPTGDQTAANSHGVEHFWLCERCTQIYTLTYEPNRGPSLRTLWPELGAVAQTEKASL